MTFSIIITCFNYARYLPDCLRSVLEQTYTDFEVIVVDDGSTDDIQDALKPFLEKIIYIKQTNRGLPAARNTGIMNSKGKYIIPLDADDMISHLYLEDVEAKIKETDADVVYCDLQIFGALNKRVPMPDIVNKESLAAYNPICYCSAIRKSCVLECGGYNVKMIHGWEDYELWMELFERGKSFVHLPYAYFMYRRHGKSMIDGCNDPEKYSYLQNTLRAYHPKIYE